MIALPPRRTVVLAGAVVAFLGFGFLAGIFIVSRLDAAPFGFWQSLGAAFGQRSDLGPVDFARLQRRTDRSDALACPQSLCPVAASDVEPPVFTIAADRLAARVRRLAMAEPRLRELPQPAADRLRFVQTSLLLRLPDVIDVQIVARSSGAATLIFYSRGAFGSADFGTNSGRLARWFDLLAQ